MTVETFRLTGRVLKQVFARKAGQMWGARLVGIFILV